MFSFIRHKDRQEYISNFIHVHLYQTVDHYYFDSNRLVVYFWQKKCLTIFDDYFTKTIFYRVLYLTCKVMIKILLGTSALAQIVDWLSVYLLVANFLQCTCVKNYETWLAVDKIIAIVIIIAAYFLLGHPVAVSYTHLTLPTKRIV